jgi:hypothetical protein
MRKNKWLVDSLTYFQTKSRLVKELDSILTIRKFSFSDSLSLVNTKIELMKEDGLESYLKPLHAFIDIYYRLTFWKKWKFYNGYETNIFNKIGMQGFLEQQVLKLSPEKNMAQLSIKFTANRSLAAQEFAPAFKASLKLINKKIDIFIPDEMTKTSSYKYDINLQNAIPTKIFVKRFSKFVVKIKNEFEMRLLE